MAKSIVLHDSYLSAYLIYLGFKPAYRINTSKRVSFVFEDSEGFQEAMKSFWNEAKFCPSEFCEVIKRTRIAMIEAKQGVNHE